MFYSTAFNSETTSKSKYLFLVPKLEGTNCEPIFESFQVCLVRNVDYRSSEETIPGVCLALADQYFLVFNVGLFSFDVYNKRCSSEKTGLVRPFFHKAAKITLQSYSWQGT